MTFVLWWNTYFTTINLSNLMRLPETLKILCRPYAKIISENKWFFLFFFRKISNNYRPMPSTHCNAWSISNDLKILVHPWRFSRNSYNYRDHTSNVCGFRRFRSLFSIQSFRFRTYTPNAVLLQNVNNGCRKFDDQ